LSDRRHDGVQALKSLARIPKRGIYVFGIWLAAHWTALVSRSQQTHLSKIKARLVASGVLSRWGLVQSSVQFASSGNYLCERFKSAVFVLHRNEASRLQLSASWLNRLEREEHELSVSKLIVLADIPTERLLRYVCSEDQRSVIKQFSGPNATMLLTGGRLDDQARNLPPDMLGPDQQLDETGLLSAHDGLLSVLYFYLRLGTG
jgi:hypothetical protein